MHPTLYSPLSLYRLVEGSNSEAVVTQALECLRPWVCAPGLPALHCAAATQALGRRLRDPAMAPPPAALGALVLDLPPVAGPEDWQGLRGVGHDDAQEYSEQLQVPVSCALRRTAVHTCLVRLCPGAAKEATAVWDLTPKRRGGGPSVDLK